MARKPRRGPHSIPTVAFDPQTGQSLTGGNDDEDARLFRLRYLDAVRALQAGDRVEYRRIMATLTIDED